MIDLNRENLFFLHPGAVFVSSIPHTVTTILGSCVSVCLYDSALKVGGINHYMLSNGKNTTSLRYGDIAIAELIERMINLHCKKDFLAAKVFGGANVIHNSGGLACVGDRNIAIAEELLKEEGIRVIASDTGGDVTRKLIFDTESGNAYIKKIRRIDLYDLN